MQIENIKEKKTMKVTLTGFPKPEVTNNGADVFKEYLNQIDPSTYSLLFDCSDLGVFKPDLVPVVEKLFRLYDGANFRHLVFIKPKGFIQDSQLKRIARSINDFSGVFVDTDVEAMDICDS